MTVRVWYAAASMFGLALALASPVLAQSGQVTCQQDIQRVSDMYNQKEASLSNQDRADVQRLLETARARCAAGGADALNTRSPEAVAILNKLENAPMPSQAAVPEGR